MIKLTKEKLKEAVDRNVTMAGVLRDLGYSKTAGGTFTHVKNKIKLFEIDTSHFKGQGWSKGSRSPKRKSTNDILVHDESKTYRAKTIQLRRALFEVGVPHLCDSCGLCDTWNGKSIVLEIDHKDGNYKNNKRENLRFLCPNCHSQV